jgi:hypothetical protein
LISAYEVSVERPRLSTYIWETSAEARKQVKMIQGNAEAEERWDYNSERF